MKKTGIIIFIAALAVGVVLANIFSFGRYFTDSKFPFSIGSKIKGSGNVVTQKRELNGFNSIEVSGAFKVVVVAQKDFGVVVEADDNIIPLVITEVDDQTLEIKRDRSFSTGSAVTIRVFAPNIEGIENSGASNVRVSNLANDSLEIHSSGASKTELEGSTGRLSVELSGASSIEASDLNSERASIDGSGASFAAVTATKELSVDLSGASRVRYKGNPEKLVRNTSGASRVTQDD